MSHISPGQDLDLSFLYEIADGSNEFIAESIELFLQQTPELLHAITVAIAGNDWMAASTAAHKLKPNLGFFGMPLSQETIQEVEIMTKSGSPDLSILHAKFNQLKTMLSENLVSLTKIRNDLVA